MSFKKKISFFVLFLSLFSFSYFLYQRSVILCDKKNQKNRYFIETLMGNFTINDDILLDGLQNGALLRMKNIDQGGPLYYFGYAPKFPRYDHCIGVWGLLRRFGASSQEQLTGLWHDISHTAFSHVADFIFDDGEKGEYSYQDSIHLWYIEHSAAMSLVDKYQISFKQLDPDNGDFNMLEQSLPDMCADRIEYNLHTAFLYNIFDKEDINKILNHLHYDTVTINKETKITKKWYFDDLISAKKFALLPLYFMKTIWNSPFNVVFYKFFSQLIRYSFKNNYLSKDMFHFGNDQEILNILYQIKDPYIESTLVLLKNIEKTFAIVDSENYDEKICPKFRGIDPLVKTKEMAVAQRLSQLDQNFSLYYNMVKDECKKGIKIKYISFDKKLI